MKLLLIFFAGFTFLTGPLWKTDFNSAKKEALETEKLIILNFSGSDWCLPCMRLRKDVFEQPEFSDYASGNLVLVNADFPRMKKNKLPEAIQKQNDSLAEAYNPGGTFPFTVLLTSDGKKIRVWEGNPGLDATAFVNEIKFARNSEK